MNMTYSMGACGATRRKHVVEASGESEMLIAEWALLGTSIGARTNCVDGQGSELVALYAGESPKLGRGVTNEGTIIGRRSKPQGKAAGHGSRVLTQQRWDNSPSVACESTLALLPTQAIRFSL